MAPPAVQGVRLFIEDKFVNAKQLRHFIAAVEAGNIQQAARDIHLTAPALSISLKNLEEDLDVKLLEKNRKGVQMTYAGEVFLKGAHSLLTQMDELRASLLEAEGSPTGKVRIGLPYGASNALAAPLFKMILTEYPGISLEIEESHTTNIERSFDSGLLDLMINYSGQDKLDRKAEPLYTEHMYLVGPFDPNKQLPKEVEPQELATIPIVASPGTHSLRTMLEKYALDNNIELRFMIDFKSAHASIKIVEEGLAHTVSPWSLIFDHVNTNLVSARKVVSPQMERTASIVTSLKEAPSAAARTIATAIKRAVNEAIEKDHLRAVSHVEN